MKTVALIFSILFLLASAGLAFLTYTVDGKDMGDVQKIYQAKEKYMAQFSDADSPEAKAKAEEIFAEKFKEVPNPSRIKIGSYISLVFMVVALAVIVLAFAKPDLLKIASIVLVSIGALSYLVHPYIKKGEYSRMSGKSDALIVLILGAIGVAAILYARYNKKTAQA